MLTVARVETCSFAMLINYFLDPSILDWGCCSWSEDGRRSEAPLRPKSGLVTQNVAHGQAICPVPRNCGFPRSSQMQHTECHSKVEYGTTLNSITVKLMLYFPGKSSFPN